MSVNAPLEHRFQQLIEAVEDYGIFILSPEGLITSWNSGAEKLKGYTRAEILGKHFSVFYEPEAIARGWPQYELEQAVKVGRFEDEGWRLRRDGSRFWANVIITAVKDEHGELSGFTKITRDLTERRKLEDLEASSRRMNEFLAMLAHELRNPLAPIRNSVSVMQLQPIDNPALIKCRDIIDRQLTHMTRLVDDLLDVGRLTTGKIKLRLETVALADVVERSVETVRPVLEARRHSIRLEMPAEPVYLRADATRLAQVVQNLLVNSARYTADGGEIEIRVESDGRIATASVTDNGRGIAPDEIESIFELFRQGANGRLPDESGLGIGLTLARSLVELHGGALRASSEGLGKGSTFQMRLPVTAAQTSPEGAPNEEQSIRRRVLVVDDNRDAADSSSDMLELLGHEVKTAYSGEQALEVASSFAPDVVLLDLSMPGIDGFEALRRLRELPGMASAFVIAMTGFGSQDDTRKTQAAGFDGHLTKPAPMPDLVRLIARACRTDAATI
ncbi:MAG: ATP-binding protein [Pseudomonadota bacterium]